MKEIVNFTAELCQYFESSGRKNISDEVATFLFQTYPEQMDELESEWESTK